MKKTVLILWIVAALFLIAAATLFAQGDIAAGVCGVVIAAVLGVIGFRKKAAPPKQEAAAPVSSAPAPAASVCEQIGNIPAEHAPFVEENFARLDGITHIDVYGGGEGRNYGAEITLRFRKQ